MPKSVLPERASLEFLKKLAKERLAELRKNDPKARLSAAQLALARDHGFPSWRALKAEVDRRNASPVDAFLDACRQGDVDTMRQLLDRDPNLVRARHASGATPLHGALQYPEAVRELIDRGADVNARDKGDNALPLHFAAGGASIDVVRMLLDAGSDVQGVGDDHKMDVIGWACCHADARRDVVALLLERGARHNIFSAIACNDLDAVRRVVQDKPQEIKRRLSKNEQEQTPVHYVVKAADGLVGGTFRTGEHYKTLELLIKLGADVNAKDAKGRTPLEIAMLQGDREAMRLLHAAGANVPKAREAKRHSDLSRSVKKIVPMLDARDIDATIAWYEAIGFAFTGSHGEDGQIDWAEVTFGEAKIMFVPSRDQSGKERSGTSLWMETNRLDDLYERLKQMQLERSRATLADEPTEVPDLQFTADLYTAFYGQREFGVKDPNGVELMFWQPLG